MQQRHITIQVILILLSLANFQLLYGQRPSRVQHFQYGGLGDNVNAFLEAYLFYSTKTKTNRDTILPLSSVTITAFDNKGKLIKSLMTNRDGYVQFEFPSGLYNLLINKKNYQPLKIANYTSVGDQVSQVEIILEKGVTTRHYRIPDWTDNSFKLSSSDSTK